ncbi:spore germination protein GerW family protein [Halorhabdus sp. CUG00001]|uniref:spore germination protein GerW family protein n=1 Tax=Halorhabdus sp. CUG00001 TaxID=2600297 RepID=UPI00131C63D4|nr:spore germination protein GerW family protein [Halorhabdus sp. CUG00001]
MEVPDAMTTAVEKITERASVERVYGDPIDRDGRTVVPVARVAYGFGGGVGEGSATSTETEGESEPAGSGSGAGGGGGGMAKPVGALEITEDGTRFVRVSDRRQLAGALTVGLLVGWLARRLLQ